MTAYSNFSTKQTPQTQPIPGKAQVKNDAGGYVFAVDDWTRLDRFLILGSDKGTYYAGEQKLTLESAECVLRCAGRDPARTVDRIVEVSQKGLAPKNEPALFALALCAASKDAMTSMIALLRLNEVARTGTHLLEFIHYCDNNRGWGRGLRNAVRRWYEQPAQRIAFQVTKYQNRDGWSHKDALRLAHPKTGGVHNDIYRWITHGWPDVGAEPHPDPALNTIWTLEKAKRAQSDKEIVRLIHEHDIPREFIPTQFLNSPLVWQALLEKGMPPTALLRNLGKMTACGALKPLSDHARIAAQTLTNQELLKSGRVHPVAIMLASAVYSSGRGVKGDLTWNPVGSILDALDDAFYLSFAAVEPTGARLVIGLDISGSMVSTQVAGAPLSCSVAAGAIALAIARTEPNNVILGFTAGDAAVEMKITPKARLDDVINAVSQAPTRYRSRATDCALPITWARDMSITADAFIILTDNQTWAGPVHVTQALDEYRRKVNPKAKLIAVAMVANNFTLADPADAGMLDIIGLDPSVPQIISQFIMG